MQKENKICFFNSTKSWGGGEKWHFDTATRLVDKGYKVVVFTNKESELYKRLQGTGIEIYQVRIGNLSFLNVAKILKLKRLFRKIGIGTIILNLPSDLKTAGVAAKMANLPKVIYRRGSAIPVKDSLLNRFLFGKVLTGVIANSQATKNTINENRELIPDEKITVIYNGIDLPEYDRRESEKLYQRQNDELIIGNAGRFVEQKNHPFLLKVAKSLKEKGIKFKMLLGGDGALLNDIKKSVREQDLDDCIIFLGFIENMKSFMSSIDVFLLPSLWEGFGYVITEAYTCSKPVLGFDISSNPEIIQNDQTGYLLPLNDLDAYVDKIIELYQDRSIISKLGENGRRFLEEKFVISESLKQLEAFLKS